MRSSTRKVVRRQQQNLPRIHRRQDIVGHPSVPLAKNIGTEPHRHVWRINNVAERGWSSNLCLSGLDLIPRFIKNKFLSSKRLPIVILQPQTDRQLLSCRPHHRKLLMAMPSRKTRRRILRLLHLIMILHPWIQQKQPPPPRQNPTQKQRRLPTTKHHPICSAKVCLRPMLRPFGNKHGRFW